jgi:hypothetical protein
LNNWTKRGNEAPGTDTAVKNALQQFAQGLADAYCPKKKKVVVTVEFVDEKGAE